MLTSRTRSANGIAVGTALLALAFVASALLGCERRVPPAPPTEQPLTTPEVSPADAARAAANAKHADVPGIDWFRGDVSAAFETAAAEDKLVFLYWGAQWCPLCQQLKASVFSRPDFIEKARLFVPVYLDGDNEGAQKWAAQFGVSGYPTVVILTAQREEVTRLAGGMDLTLYASVLDNALANAKPADTLLASIRKSGATLREDDCRRLAYNAWTGQDIAADERARLASDLATAARRCPRSMPVERARLVLTAAALTANLQSERAAKPSKTMKALMRDVEGIIADPAQTVALVDTLALLDDDFFAAVKAMGPKFAASFLEQWNAAMDRIVIAPALAEGSRLGAVAMKIRGTKALQPGDELSRDLVRESRERVEGILLQRQDPYVRAGIVNAASWVYEELGDLEAASRMLRAELSGPSATYYMVDIGLIDERLGRVSSALDWLERAYRESTGTATRFQWGDEYLRGLLRMVPDDTARIQAVGLRVLGELDGPDRLHARTAKRLARLEKALSEWSEGGRYPEVVGALRERMAGICRNIPPTDESRESCTSFLA